mmetsp:Transcript_71730/g.126611  ORF Transcript_71730/g.126611 Transcript_71730/m.126611 type:complete len:1165 (-) Transcript_71730:237-3731(-)|eukprot:CAMPEP_0197640258 /NCGR_PEP_ID=MMETSP1338-20131121/14607_1 /TAXON_ID=43686 ORGANISM="Pelagodinium beii, Strain RCC1491" /NCGR_SAMPLE_ID=MMETSP1338 /ASSEMBLY_ACC=CAM_ASM_000754 /LENGTH=1164 /DNA_ID=CAMNT_0043213089 /DNA_START=31 /DNA_END=3525 /DNA_ORIENTATION=+
MVKAESPPRSPGKGESVSARLGRASSRSTSKDTSKDASKDNSKDSKEDFAGEAAPGRFAELKDRLAAYTPRRLVERFCTEGSLAYRASMHFIDFAERAAIAFLRLLKLLGWAIIQVVCYNRLRRDALERNQWITLRPRFERLEDLKHKQADFNKQQLKVWRSRGLSRQAMLYRTVNKAMGDLGQSIYDTFMQAVGGRDRESGLPNDLLARWRMLSVIGQGPHGLVFKACLSREGETEKLERKLKDEELVAVRIRDKAAGQIVRLNLRRACKLLSREVTQGSMLLRRLRKILARLRLLRLPVEHEGLAELLDVKDTGEFFIEVVEYLPGGSLYRYLERQEMMDECTVCRIARRLFQVIEYLHSRRLIHRDIRLAQLILAHPDDPETAKLADLWCMIRLPANRHSVREEGRPCDIGSSPPEVLLYGEYSEKSDVWSAACAVFEMLHGHPPFGGKGEALVQRICQDGPEYSSFGTGHEGISEKGLDLLDQMFKRAPAQRPSIATCLKHPWFEEFGGKKPVKKIWQSERRIRRTQLFGRPPMSRSNLPASNLLASRPGEMNAGFCTYMGATSCDIDFEVRGKADFQEYWVVHCVIALWGREENPKHITVKASVRPGAPWSDVGSFTVTEVSQTEARVKIDKPLRFVRISFRGNFGGSFGIALRKVTFYGFEARQHSVNIDLAASTYLRGSTKHSHTEELQPKDVDEMVHKSIIPGLRNGRRIEGTNLRYKVYEDISSGAPHITTAVETPKLKLPKDVTLKGAIFGLRYVSEVPSREAQPPKIRLQLVREIEDEDRKEKQKLFETEELWPPEWKTEDILQKGYLDYPIMFTSDLDISTNRTLSLEVLFQNYAGTLHIPAELGLSFYYVPELGTPSSDEEHAREGETLADKKIAARRQGGMINTSDITSSALGGNRGGGSSAAAAQSLHQGGITSTVRAAAAGQAAGEAGSEAGDSDALEAEYQAEVEKKEHDFFYGLGGAAQKMLQESSAYRPEIENPGEQWWDGMAGGKDDDDAGSLFSEDDSDEDGGQKAAVEEESDNDEAAAHAHEESHPDGRRRSSLADRAVSAQERAQQAASKAETAVSQLKQEAMSVHMNRQTVRDARRERKRARREEVRLAAEAANPSVIPVWLQDVAVGFKTCNVEMASAEAGSMCSRITKGNETTEEDDL